MGSKQFAMNLGFNPPILVVLNTILSQNCKIALTSHQTAVNQIKPKFYRLIGQLRNKMSCIQNLSFFIVVFLVIITSSSINAVTPQLGKIEGLSNPAEQLLKFNCCRQEILLRLPTRIRTENMFFPIWNLETTTSL